MATPDLTARPDATAPGGRPGLAQRLATETKAAFKTTEFWLLVLLIPLLLIAANSIEIKEGGTDYFTADKVWLYITILASAYMISRGLAKSGSKDPYWGDSGHNRNRDGGAG